MNNQTFTIRVFGKGYPRSLRNEIIFMPLFRSWTTTTENFMTSTFIASKLILKTVNIRATCGEFDATLTCWTTSSDLYRDVAIAFIVIVSEIFLNGQRTEIWQLTVYTLHVDSIQFYGHLGLYTEKRQNLILICERKK